jgi:hypothetical protein
VSILQQLAAVATIGQLIVIGAGAYFAFRQIDRLRRQQEAELVQSIFATLNAPEFATALNFVYNDLSKRLNDAAYLREIAEYPGDRGLASGVRRDALFQRAGSVGAFEDGRRVSNRPDRCVAGNQRALSFRERASERAMEGDRARTGREAVQTPGR